MAGAVLVTTHFTRREIPFLLQPVGQTPRFSLLKVWKDVSSTFANRDFMLLFFGALLYAEDLRDHRQFLGIYVKTYFWNLAPEQLQWFSADILGAFFGLRQHWPDRAVVRQETAAADPVSPC